MNIGTMVRRLMIGTLRHVVLAVMLSATAMTAMVLLGEMEIGGWRDVAVFAVAKLLALAGLAVELALCAHCYRLGWFPRWCCRLQEELLGEEE